jgi:hypothetical protein
VVLLEPPPQAAHSRAVANIANNRLVLTPALLVETRFGTFAGSG